MALYAVLVVLSKVVSEKAAVLRDRDQHGGALKI
jgi:hypothetical protein